MENTPATPTTALPPITPDNFFDRYHVISAGTEMGLGHAYCTTVFVLADKLTYSLEDAMNHAHSLADELRNEIIEDNLWATEDLIDWEAYDPDDFDSDVRYEIMYEFGLEHSDAWTEEIENWDELIRVATYSDDCGVWVVDADYELMKAIRLMVTAMIDGATTTDDESPNCGDTTNSRSE